MTSDQIAAARKEAETFRKAAEMCPPKLGGWDWPRLLPLIEALCVEVERLHNELHHNNFELAEKN